MLACMIHMVRMLDSLKINFIKNRLKLLVIKIKLKKKNLLDRFDTGSFLIYFDF